jgi:hypothetical protein
MCCTCDARTALDDTARTGIARFKWEARPDVGLEVQANGGGAEFAPARLRFRRMTPSGTAKWSPWVDTDDLAGAMSRLGTDIKWEFGTKEVQGYLTGRTRIAPVLALLGGGR